MNAPLLPGNVSKKMQIPLSQRVKYTINLCFQEKKLAKTLGLEMFQSWKDFSELVLALFDEFLAMTSKTID